ncbi:MAG: hypothetical protein H0X34_10295 [Chthoniobacterales bacterium]|nr:hypothetical protein [Chthoniobacterales bacterium]
MPDLPLQICGDFGELGEGGLEVFDDFLHDEDRIGEVAVFRMCKVKIRPRSLRTSLFATTWSQTERERGICRAFGLKQAEHLEDDDDNDNDSDDVKDVFVHIRTCAYQADAISSNLFLGCPACAGQLA